MWGENKEVNKLHKIGLIILKLIPMLLAFVYFINTVLSYYNIDTTLLSYIGGMSLIPLVFLYLASYMFRFCSYHRMFLHYILITDIINIYDYYIGIPLNILSLISLHMIFLCIAMFLTLYLYMTKGKHKR